MNAELLMQEVKALEGELIANRRTMHNNPETGFDLTWTVEFVKSKLEDMGLNPQLCGKAGLVATIGGKKPGKVIMLRADMDALPVEEQSGEEFASTNGRMHGCGHDFHTSMLLAAAKVLKNHEDELDGTVKLMFQPAEEIFEGSKDMIDAGLLQNPAVDAAVMCHVNAAMPFPSGSVIVMGEGVSALACDFFEIQIQGRGCHGAMPEMGVDPINIAAHILLAFQEIRAREHAMADQAVLTVCALNAGNANNVIPDTAVMKGSLRTTDLDVREATKARMVELAEAVAKAYRGEAKVIFTSGCPTQINNGELSKDTDRYAKELLGPGMAFSVPQLAAMAAAGGKKNAGTSASDDFSYITQEVPSIMFSLAVGSPQNGYVHPVHHPMVRMDESALVNGAALFAHIAMRWLEDHKE